MIFIVCMSCAQGRLRVEDHINNVPMGGAIWMVSSIYVHDLGMTDHGSLPPSYIACTYCEFEKCERWATHLHARHSTNTFKWLDHDISGGTLTKAVLKFSCRKGIFLLIFMTLHSTTQTLTMHAHKPTLPYDLWASSKTRSANLWDWLSHGQQRRFLSSVVR
jgi:hypothetical protein